MVLFVKNSTLYQCTYIYIKMMFLWIFYFLPLSPTAKAFTVDVGNIQVKFVIKGNGEKFSVWLYFIFYIFDENIKPKP